MTKEWSKDNYIDKIVSLWICNKSCHTTSMFGVEEWKPDTVQQRDQVNQSNHDMIVVVQINIHAITYKDEPGVK